MSRRGKDSMIERLDLEGAGYILHSDLVQRLRARFPDAPLARLEQIVAAENEAITGGILQVVPAEVETGAVEILQRDGSTDRNGAE